MLGSGVLSLKYPMDASNEKIYLLEEQLSNDSITNAYKALYQHNYAKYANDLDAYYKDIIS